MNELEISSIDSNFLDKIVRATMQAVENGKKEIFNISEAARRELEIAKRDVENIKKETLAIIDIVDKLELQEKLARNRLMEIHKNFRSYNEEQTKKAYEETSKIQIKVAVAKEKELSLRHQRDSLEIRMRNLQNTVQHAETLVATVGAALDLLGSHMHKLSMQIETMQQYQVFVANVFKAVEDERHRLSREIHDGPAQALANLVFRAEICEKLVDIDLVKTKTELKNLRESVRAVLKEIRKCIANLRPMALDDLGLVPTIQRFIDSIADQNEICIDLRVVGNDRRLASHIEVGVFRIMQETLNNIEKHAKAKNVSVTMEFGIDSILVNIVDDGCGFNTDKVAKSERQSFGLRGMQERIHLLQGVIKVESAEGKGTKVFIKVPVTEID